MTNLRKLIGLLFVVIGLAMLFYPQLEKVFYDQEQKKLIASFEQLGNTEFIQQFAADEKARPTSAWNEDVMHYGMNEESILDDARGLMRIKSIDLEMVIFDGSTSEHLGKGAATVVPEKQFATDNVGIAGHRALVKGKQFNRLGDVQKKDQIEIVTKEGVFEYEVVQSFIVHKSDISVLDDQEKPFITLITCTPIGRPNPPDRLIVQAELKNVRR